MAALPVRLRAAAAADVDGAVDHYLSAGGTAVATEYVATLERALERIGRRPTIGSPRFAYELRLPGLRARSLSRFPYVVFYVEAANYVDVWRVLHARRDIPTALANAARD